MRNLPLLLAKAFLFATICCLLLHPDFASSESSGVTRHFKFNVKMKNVRRLCHTKRMLTVNGKFPGRPLVVREGDRVLVNVTNHVPNNLTIHWHGIRQLRSGWSDGPAYITQCPIKTGQSYVYNFTIVGQRGTLWWHAHASWLRATIYGPLIILPKHNVSYPFDKPHKEVTLMLGEWWNTDTESVIRQALQTGAAPNVSDAFTINGFPGPLYNCSEKNETYKLRVKAGKTYLLRIINADMNDDLFFSIANHTLTVVEADANYVKPFETDILYIAPGQTTNVLLKTKSQPPNASFLIAARPYSTARGTIDNTTTAGVLSYETVAGSKQASHVPLIKPSLPAINDTSTAANFSSKLRSLANSEFPANVPKTVQKQFFFTVGLGTNPCPRNQTCQGPNGTKFAASVNNVSFSDPRTAILQSYFSHKFRGIYTTDFPADPPMPFNYTGTPPNNTGVIDGTKVMVLPFNTSVEVVMQDTNILGAESHPLHLHGHNFYLVGQGFGNFDPDNDPAKYNLIDPVERNTANVPSGGWAAVRFITNNPGVWFMHCHFDVHLSWGLKMVWIILDGELPDQKLPPPPSDLPKC